MLNNSIIETKYCNDKYFSNPYMQTYTSYIHIDSSRRSKEFINTFDEELYSLPPFAIKFMNGSSIINIELPNHSFAVDDRISLNNITSKNIILQNILMVKKNSFFVRIFHENHGLSLSGLYDPSNSNHFNKVGYVEHLPSSYTEFDDIPDGRNEYYILKDNSKFDFRIQLSNIKGCDFTRGSIGSIPTNYLNKKQTVYLVFNKNSNMYIPDPNSYLIMLEKKSSINYMDGINFIKDKSGLATLIPSTNTIYIKFYNLFGIPLNYLNSGTPINENTKHPYHTILETSSNNFTIDVGYSAIVDPNTSFYNYTDTIDQDIDISKLINSNSGGGSQIYVRKITSTINGYPNPNDYVYEFGCSYHNLVQVKLVGSEFPNSQRIINTTNNNLYWRNLDDGDHIYQLSITPGNYSPQKLKHEIEKEFNNTIRYKYSEEFLAGIIPKIVKKSTPINNLVYDENGYNKYHIVDVSICDINDKVSFSAYKEIVQFNQQQNIPIISVPDNMIEFTMTEDLRTNFGNSCYSSEQPEIIPLVPQFIKPFDPQNGEILYIYFTPKCHTRLPENFMFAYNNLYQYLSHTKTDPNNFNTFLAKLENTRAVLVNFYRTKDVYPLNISTNEINSINSSTVLENFSYNYLSREIHKYNHNLKIGDLVITDQFIDPDFIGEIFVYEIECITDSDKFIVKKYNHGEKYKFIYDGIIINFNNTNEKNSQYWLDQISPTDQISPMNIDQNNTLSFISVIPQPENKIFMRIYHPNHQLEAGTVITITNSSSINQVPASTINGQHIINKIFDENSYEVLLGIYTSVKTIEYPTNLISIRYPDIFQMFFNFDDTLGNILGFKDVGQDVAVTPYKKKIRNVDPYGSIRNVDPGYDLCKPIRTKLEMTGYNYFYICCPELANIQNTNLVSNIFAIVRWTENPGNIVFDSFVPTVKIFNAPLSSLSKLHFTFYHPDGRLVEFNGLDHSFTIEIIGLYGQPSGINPGINSIIS